MANGEGETAPGRFRIRLDNRLSMIDLVIVVAGVAMWVLALQPKIQANQVQILQVRKDVTSVQHRAISEIARVEKEAADDMDRLEAKFDQRNREILEALKQSQQQIETIRVEARDGRKEIGRKIDRLIEREFGRHKQ